MRLPVAAKIALPLAAFLAPHHRRVAHGGGGRLFASGKIIVDGLVRGGRAVIPGCVPILARLSIMPQVALKHCAPPRYFQMRDHAAGCLIRKCGGLEIMMEESSWIEPNSTK